MEKGSRIIGIYEQTGYYMDPEDIWNAECIITSKKDLVNWMIDLNKKSASNFNDYPFVSLFHTDNISYLKQDYIIDDNGDIYYGVKTEIDNLEYHDEAAKEYHEWFAYIKLRLPKIRKMIEDKEKIEKEKKLLNILKNKYE